MELTIIIILSIVVFLLIIYLFLVKKELNRISVKINEYKVSNSNSLIHSKISNCQLSKLINNINSLLSDIKSQKIFYEHKNKELKKMMTNISHDLRTPLTSALGYIDIILNSELKEEEKQKKLVIIKNRLERLEELINSFFEFSKIFSSDKKPDLAQINLIALVEECILHYYEDYKKQDRQIMLKKSVVRCQILSNRNMLTRVFDNLIGNALKHDNGNLEIKIDTNDKKVKVVFSNNLLNENLDIDHIFDEFYTTEISRTKGNNGLGLAIAKEFTEILNGTIYAQKESGKIMIFLEFDLSK